MLLVHHIINCHPIEYNSNPRRNIFTAITQLSLVLIFEPAKVWCLGFLNWFGFFDLCFFRSPVVIILSLFSLIYGIYFLFFPFHFANLTEAKHINIAWLRSIGASITGLLFIGIFNTKGLLLWTRLSDVSV